jgi:hypothetical protein
VLRLARESGAIAKAKSYEFAKAAFELDKSDQNSARLLYYSCLMSGHFREAARLLRKLPEHQGPASYVHRLDAERRALSKAAAPLKSFLAAGGRADRLARPGLGEQPARSPIRRWGKDILGERFVESQADVRQIRSGERFGDFVFAFEAQVMELPWDVYGRFVLARVGDDRDEGLFNVGVDGRGRLLLWHHWMEAVGPCEKARPSPEWNEVKIVREGARVDGYVNGELVASTYVPASAKLRVFATMHNGVFDFRNVAILTKGLGGDGEEADF